MMIMGTQAMRMCTGTTGPVWRVVRGWGLGTRWDVHWVRVDLGVMEEGTEGSGGGQ